MTSSIVSDSLPSGNMVLPVKPPKKLRAKEEAAINLKFQGKGNPEIGKILGVKPGTVSAWFCIGGKLNKPYASRCAELLNPSVNPAITNAAAQSVAERIKSAAPDALSEIVSLSKSAKREQVRFQSSADILDRAGYAPVQKNMNVDIVADMSLSELDALALEVLGAPSAQHARIEQDAHDMLDVSVDAEVDALVGESDNVSDEDEILDSLL